jgi:hypothetical protein
MSHPKISILKCEPYSNTKYKIFLFVKLYTNIFYTCTNECASSLDEGEEGEEEGR